MKARLSAFLDGCAKRPFEPGRFDCALFVADWLVALGLPDPARAYRGRYRTLIGMERVLRREGGLFDISQRTFPLIGLSASDRRTAEIGDVGAVVGFDSERRSREAGAICCGDDLWVALGVAGLVFGPFRPVFAWRPPCRP